MMSKTQDRPSTGVAPRSHFDWNVVVTVHRGGFKDACQFLEQFGTVEQTPYYNVLVMRVADVHDFLERLHAWATSCTDVKTFLASVVPVTHTFVFHTPEEFEQRATEIALKWTPFFVGKRFHVRMHRRGFSGQLPSPEEERFLDTVLMDALADDDVQGRIGFNDPDAIVAVETVDDRAGLSLWTREDLGQYPLLKVD